MKGFTLIELLVVIAILGIIIAAVVAGINPVDKINAANDAKVQADIGTIATAFEINTTLNGGIYASDQVVLKNSGDLKDVIAPPFGYTYNYGVGGTSQFIWSTLKSQKYSLTPKWTWCSSTGVASAQTDAYNCP